jgi:hypothetical protein
MPSRRTWSPGLVAGPGRRAWAPGLHSRDQLMTQRLRDCVESILGAQLRLRLF